MTSMTMTKVIPLHPIKTIPINNSFIPKNSNRPIPKGLHGLNM